MATKGQLEREVSMGKCRAAERKISDNRYAWQKEFGLIQKIVFTFVGLIVMAFIGALINLTIK